jgi:beta-phosphoglucomutase-like phosphatase (HAD superfamily)
MQSLDGLMAFVYDLDGTVVESQHIHNEGWKYAASEFGIELTPKMLIDQKGMKGDEAAKMMLKIDDASLIQEFRKVKKQYVANHVGDMQLYPGFVDTVEFILTKDKHVWICTAASPPFVDKLMASIQNLAYFKNRIVTSDMYDKGKPNPEPLLKTLELIGGLKQSQGIYIGDAFSDYGCARNARTKFCYFNPAEDSWDERIPSNTMAIQKHTDLCDYF